MHKNRVLWCALAGAVLAVWLGSWALAQPQDRQQPVDQQPPGGQVQPAPPSEPPPDATPEEIAEFCITRATERADRCVHGNEITAERSVAIIEQLLELGQPEDAHAVARWSICWVNTHSARCITGIKRLCRRCTQAIIRAGGSPELVERVRTACREQIKRVADSREAAVEAIKAALPEQPEPEAAPEANEG